MNLSAILGPEIYTTTYQREQCRLRLADLRLVRAQAQARLLDMCCDLQRNPQSLDPELISQAMAQIRYLDGRTEELEKFLTISRTSEDEKD